MTTQQPRHRRPGASDAVGAAEYHRPRHSARPETRPMPAVRPDTPSGDFYGDEDQIARGGMGHVEGILFTAVCALLALIFVTLVGVNIHRALGVTGDLVLAAVIVAVVGMFLQSSKVHR